MRTILIFVGVYLLSLMAAFTVGIQIAIYFFLQEEFIAVMFALEIYSLVAIVAFAVVYVIARDVIWFGYTAIALGVLALIVTALPALIDAFSRRSTNPALVGSTRDNALIASIIFPALVMLLIEWPLLRRRWLMVRHAEHRMLWPWVTITVACFFCLNRLGMDVIVSAVQQSPTDWLGSFWLLIALIGAGVLFVLGLIEWFLRRRWIARRAAA